MEIFEKIGFGGGCHWCTEDVFKSLINASKVEQGWIGSECEYADLSEAIIVHYDPSWIDLKTLIEIHLNTHACTSDHSMRSKYRSAIYTFKASQVNFVKHVLKEMQSAYDKPIITKVLPFNKFKVNCEDQLDYFLSRPNAPFCKKYIHPKLKKLEQKFSELIEEDVKSIIN